MKALTIAAAKAALAARAPAMTLRKTDGGDFRVTFTQAAIAAAFPAMTRAELIEKAESLAAYESDAESALATGLAMAETGLQPLPQPGTVPDYDAAWSKDDGWQKPAPATAEAAPAPEADKPGREYIDMTPTWAAMESTFRLLIENGNAEGRRTAWGEIAKALRLADERNEMAAELRRRETAELSDVIQAYEMRSDGVQAAGAIVLRRLPDNDATPFVVHFRNDADSERMGRPCYYSGDYCANLAEAWAAFGEKCRRYDPTGALAA